MNRMTLKAAVLVLIGLGIRAGEVRADKAQLEERLKQGFSIQLEDVTIAQALEQIGQRAGLRIELSPEAVWKLPEGRDTRLSVTLEGRLSESLEKMLNSFFLRYAVGSESLTVYPRPELKRIMGRPTAEELKLLTDLYGNSMWFSVQTDMSDSNAERFAQAVFKGVTIMGPDGLSAVGRAIRRIASKTSPSPAGRQDPNLPKGTPMTLALFLEGVERSGDRPEKTWYIEGPEFPRQVPEIWIVTREDFWQKHLDQIVDVSFRNETVESIIASLAAQGDLEVRFQGQWVREEVAARKMTLEVQNVKLSEALDRVISATSIYQRVLLSEGVIEVHVPPQIQAARQKLQQAPSDVQSGGGYVGKISIPMDGGKYFIVFMLRERDLTEVLRRLRQEKIRAIIEQLSEAAKEPTQ